MTNEKGGLILRLGSFYREGGLLFLKFFGEGKISLDLYFLNGISTDSLPRRILEDDPTRITSLPTHLILRVKVF